MRIRFGRAFAQAALLVLLAALPLIVSAQAVPFVGAYGQDFDELAATGTANSTLPAGWAIAKGTTLGGTYAADSGGTASGNIYSYGLAGSSDRALGSLATNAMAPVPNAAARIGLALSNATGESVANLPIAYVGEQWRLGATGRDEKLFFEYSLDAANLLDADATWVAVPALDLLAPVRSGGLGALDGTLAQNQVQVSGSLLGLNWQPGQTLWLRWTDFNISGNDDGLAIDDLLVGTAEDLPPVLVSSTPANGAVDVAIGSTLRLQFSEPVAVQAAAIDLRCAGVPQALSSNSPAALIVLTPSSPLPYASACSLRVPAAAVVDLDGSPDTLAADIEIDFQTIADLPPQLVSSVPADGASGVAPAVSPRLRFSEPVQLTAPAFELNCSAGGAIALSHPVAGEEITLSLGALLDEGDSCTLRLLASRISDLGGQALPADVYIGFTVSEGVGDYYARVNTSSPEQLRCSLHEVIRGHTAYPYSGSTVTSTWTILELAEEHPDDPGRIIDVYRNRSFVKGAERAGTGTGITYNREHTWPNSLGFPGQTDSQGRPNAPYTDTHMLYLTDTGYNADRGNMPYADCPASAGCSERVTEVNLGIGGGSGVYPGNSNWFRGPNGNQGSFEVWPARRGDMARAVMYMAIRYEGGVHPVTGQAEPDLRLTDTRSLIVNTSASPAYMGLLSDLLAWHEADPPDAAERRRNDVVQQFQGNRNPFIDHPEWASNALFTATPAANCELLTPLPPAVFADGFEAR